MQKNKFRLGNNWGPVVGGGGLLVLLCLFLVPLHPSILDLLLVLNIVFALILLIRAMFMEEPSRFFAFPTILLMATLFRLGLNVSSTRLILLEGDQSAQAAGQVIEAFGNFVVQGDFIVGGIIFAVIAVVNFVVIAKGSARVAEVSARFSLDALPGKQLAIDSELRAKTITPEEAARRRNELSRESRFFGSMDGAMKFVQGDAIAGFVITFINLIGGLSLGVGRGLSFQQALDSFGLLTIGDGLVSIIPSLLVSICAGLVVTHVSGSEEGASSGGQVFEQVFSDTRSFVVAGAVLVILGLLTNLPALPFLLVGLPVLIWGIWSGAPIATQTKTSPIGLASASVASKSLDYFSLAPITLRIGEEMVESVSTSYERLRDSTFQERGVTLPEISFEENAQDGQSYEILVQNNLVSRGVLHGGQFCLPISSKQLAPLGAIVSRTTKSPIDSRDICWLENSEQNLELARQIGVKAVSEAEHLAEEVRGAALEHLDSLFGLSELNFLVDKLRAQYPKLVEEVLDREVLSLGELNEVVSRLVSEQISIRSLRSIFEGVLEFHSTRETSEEGINVEDLHSYLRKVLAKNNLKRIAKDGNHLRAFLLGTQAEEEFRSAVRIWDGPRSRLPLSPQVESSLRDKFEKLLTPAVGRGALPVVVIASGDIRAAVHRFLGSILAKKASFITFSFEELGNGFITEPVGTIELQESS